LCHTRMLLVSHDKKTVDCVVCGSHGTLKMVDGLISVDFTKEELERSRLKWGGKLEHSTEIKTQAQPSGTIKNLKELKQPYADFNPGVFAKEEGAFGNLK
ncbi:MAG: flavodoxin family protein, partial [Pseudobutyrivibrio sp.]|nr:flavodoxin family protein [Pseudobutyrivibrio sp.]